MSNDITLFSNEELKHLFYLKAKHF